MRIPTRPAALHSIGFREMPVARAGRGCDRAKREGGVSIRISCRSLRTAAGSAASAAAEFPHRRAARQGQADRRASDRAAPRPEGRSRNKTIVPHPPGCTDFAWPEAQGRAATWVVTAEGERSTAAMVYVFRPGFHRPGRYVSETPTPAKNCKIMEHGDADGRAGHRHQTTSGGSPAIQEGVSSLPPTGAGVPAQQSRALGVVPAESASINGPRARRAV